MLESDLLLQTESEKNPTKPVLNLNMLWIQVWQGTQIEKQNILKIKDVLNTHLLLEKRL